jgi:hypothetical protein
MIKTVDKTTLETWQGNLEPDKQVAVKTTHGIIKLKELETFIQQIKDQQADSIRIHLLRYTPDVDEPQKKDYDPGKRPRGCTWSVAENKKTQVGIAISGNKGFHLDGELITEADELSNGQILLLFPGEATAGPTGHNPPSK